MAGTGITVPGTPGTKGVHDRMYSCKGNWKIYHSGLLSGAA